jgi:hypothetical protein
MTKTEWNGRMKWGDIPEHMRLGIVRYVERGIPPGNFLEALIANDLMEAVRRADAESLDLIGQYAKLLYNQCPTGCRGSRANYDEWVRTGGLYGKQP